ncbi:MAG: PAS domain-containing protein [Flavobacteriales bacterium]|nr:PAS domain-containing protein [Flavobacteriales bacterium]MCB9194070.1 PAS domain-containing protein [Flavobacteriales bacterium]
MTGKPRNERRDPRMGWELAITVLLALGGLAVLVSLLFTAYHSLSEYERQNDAIRRSWALMHRVERYMSDLNETESSCLAYLLKDDSARIAEYHRARNEATRDLATLEQQLPDSSKDKWIVLVRRRHKALMDHLDGMVSAKNSQVAPDPDALEDERRFMAHLQSACVVVQSQSSIGLARRSDKERSLARFTPQTFFAFGALALLGLAILFIRILQTLQRVKRAREAEQAMGRQRDKEARTRELAERQLQRVVDATHNGILSLRCLRGSDGAITDMKVILANAAAGRNFGRPKEDLAGMRMSELLPAMYHNGLFDLWARVVEGEASGTSGMELDLGQGAHWFEIGAVRLLDGLVVTFRDMTERRELEARATRDQRLAGIGRFARVLAHEVRNPLTNIHLALDQLGEDLSPEARDRAEVYMSILRRNAERIDQHVTQLLQSSRPLTITLEPGDVRPVLDEVIAQVRDRCRLLSMKWTLAIEDDLPPVAMDVHTLTIALVNLCVNAIEAMEEERGELLLAARRSGEGVVVEVTDNGHGMSEDQLDRIFQPFFSGRSDGMGLGLAESRNILDAHGASVSVKSRSGEGTTFLIGLRGAEGSPSRPPAGKEQVADEGKQEAHQENEVKHPGDGGGARRDTRATEDGRRDGDQEEGSGRIAER